MKAIGWLDSIPAGWTVAPLYARYEVQLGKMLDESRKTGTNSRPYLRNVDVQWDRINVADLPEMDFDVRDRSKFSLKKGDLLVCEGGEVGRTAMWNGQAEECYFQKALHRLRPKTLQENPRYLLYVMRTAADYGVFAADSNPNTIPHLTAERLRRYRFPFPPYNDQHALAEFLDVEISKIDDFVSAYQRLLALLSEDVNSRVLLATQQGDCPELRFARAAEVVRRPVDQMENEWYTPIGLFNRGRGLFHKAARQKDDMGDSDFFWVEAGDLIVSGQFAWEGAVAIAETNDATRVVSHRYHVLRGKDYVALTEYLLAFLSTNRGDFLLNENSRGAAGRNRPLNIGSLLKERIPVPDTTLQQPIARAVNRKRVLSRLIGEQLQSIETYRSSLISAAVLGQIDVRNYRPQEAAAVCQ